MPARVTVLITNHNYGHFVCEAIGSAADDPYDNKLIMVVDDGSTDGSVDKIVSNLTKAERWKTGVAGFWQGSNIIVRVLAATPARGPSAGRNLGIKATWEETDIYAVLDADDKFLPGKLAKSVKRLEDNWGHIGAVYSDYETVDIVTGVRKIVHKEPFSRERLLRECIVHSACVIPKYTFEKIGVYDENLRVCEDYDMWLRASEWFVLSHIPEVLMTVRVGSYNSTGSVQNEVWQNCLRRVYEKVNERANNG